MSKKYNRPDPEIKATEIEPMESHVQNIPPTKQWASFDNFWSTCVKNGTPLLKDSFRAHLKALGWINRPEKFIDGALHFGIVIEKDKK